MELFRKYEHLQIEEVCRICLIKKEQMSLIYEAGLADMLLECASVQVTPENGLFNLVCSHCANEVSRWYVFKQQVVRSFEIGRYLLDKKNKSIDNSINNVESVKNELNFTTIQDETSNNSNTSNSSSIIEDVEKLESLLKKHNSQHTELKCNEDHSTQEELNLFVNPDISNNILSTDPTNNNYNISSITSVNIDKCEELNDTEVVNPSPGTQNRKKKSLNELLCKICHKQCTSTNSFNRHIKTHDDSRPFVCCKCDKPFKTSQVLAEHMKRHYDDRRHKCGVCGQKFYAKASLNDHMRSHTGERPFKCEVCGRSFATKAILRQHTVVHTAREKKYQCEICSKLLLTAGSLETHKRKHSGLKPFKCGGCEKSFFTKEAMQRHFGAIHDTDNNFLCNICSKVCSTKVHLNNHMKKKHLGLGRPTNAVCNECGKQCGSAAELKVHVRVHTGERPYICDICDKRFIAKGNLNSHKQRHSGKKPFLCNHCGKAFGEKSTLKVHERIHTGEHPYKCNVCGKAYVQSSALRTHMKSHWR